MNEISNDGREVWDWAGRLSGRVHQTAELRRTLQQLHNTLNTCGSCSDWMTPNCPRETHDNRTGRSHGPSCGAVKCASFVMSPSGQKSADLAEAKIAELRQRLQSDEKHAATAAKGE